MTSKKRLRALGVEQRRDWLIQSLRKHLLPIIIKQGFEVAPDVGGGPVDREVVLRYPLGRLRRIREGSVDLIEIQLAPHRRPAFRIIAGVAPKEGLLTFTGHWAAENLHADWLDECFVTHARPWLRPLGVELLGAWFSVWNWPWRSPTPADYDTLALRVAGYVPELEWALREGRLGRHVRRVVIPRPPIPTTTTT